MNPATATPLPAHGSERINVNGASGVGLIELRNGSTLVVQVLPSGALFALRHGTVLINQLLPGPAEDGLFRLLLRWRAVDRKAEAAPWCWAPLVGAGLGGRKWGGGPEMGSGRCMLADRPDHGA